MKKITSLLCAFAITAGTVALFPAVNAEAVVTGNMRDVTTMQIVDDMGLGINLGNTFEACGDWIAQWSDGSVQAYETAWGSPVVTKEMIQGFANEGFGVLRIPTAWSNRMIDDGTYTIDKEWTARIQQIVDWTIESGMYAIINIHWDNGWVNTFPENKDECMKRFETMWKQIAESFKDYGDYLMFESQNEELGWESLYNKWNPQFNDKEGSYRLVNEVNQKFVDVVRASGGNNAKRHLLISGYNTGFDTTCDSLFKMPSDPANRCAVSVHYYTPVGFAILEEDADWGKATYTWGSDADYQELRTNMDMMKNSFVDKGIPVIIGEYGCPMKNENGEYLKDPDSIRLFLSSVCEAAYSRDMCPVLWSTPGGHYNRETYKLEDPKLRAEYERIYNSKEHEDISETTQPEETTETTQPTETQPTESETTQPEIPERLFDDVNNDGVVNIADALLLKKHILGISELDGEQIKSADFNNDGIINVFDYLVLQKKLIS